MTHSYEELKKKTIDQLREIAKGLDHEAVHGFTQMNKDHLLPAVCRALGIDAHVHHHASADFDKAAIKARIRRLKGERTKALQAKDHGQLKQVRRQIHRLKRRIRSATV